MNLSFLRSRTALFGLGAGVLLAATLLLFRTGEKTPVEEVRPPVKRQLTKVRPQEKAQTVKARPQKRMTSLQEEKQVQEERPNKQKRGMSFKEREKRIAKLNPRYHPPALVDACSPEATESIPKGRDISFGDMVDGQFEEEFCERIDCASIDEPGYAHFSDDFPYSTRDKRERCFSIDICDTDGLSGIKPEPGLIEGFYKHPVTGETDDRVCITSSPCETDADCEGVHPSVESLCYDSYCTYGWFEALAKTALSMPPGVAGRPLKDIMSDEAKYENWDIEPAPTDDSVASQR